MINEGSFDVVLMDIRMPGMTGMEAIRQLREQPETRSMPVIAVTASVFPEFQEQIKAAGFDEFLGKPFRSGELFHKLRELLQLKYTAPEESKIETTAVAKKPSIDSAEAGWPMPLARASIKRIRSAVELGDITALSDLADKLRIDGRAPARDIDTIARLGRSFDFDGLTEFARHLERSLG
jgi:DNA-binding response OmpR family regulator